MIYPKLSDGTIDWCVMCKHEGRDLFDGCCECEYPENYDDPPTKYEPKSMTNADRIRSMTDEELAALFKDHFCPMLIGADMDCQNSCEKCWLEWLKEESEQKSAGA